MGSLNFGVTYGTVADDIQRQLEHLERLLFECHCASVMIRHSASARQGIQFPRLDVFYSSESYNRFGPNCQQAERPLLLMMRSM